MQEALSREWLDIASMDLSSAEYLMNMRPVPIEIICYHCEQAAEKLLKGVLVFYDMEPPKTHDLLQLCKLCEQKSAGFAELVDACAELSPYGVQIRYPAHIDLDEHDMHCALRECRKINEFVRTHLTTEHASE